MARILVVEDDNSLQTAYKMKLESSGYTVMQAFDGQTGLEMALDQHPDLVMTDVMMPKMDGMEMVKELRTDVWGANVPVIILTNKDTTDSEIEGVMASHPAYYLLKGNVSMEEIVEKIREILG